MAADETIVDRSRFGTDAAGYRSLARYAKQRPDRTWAIEGCEGIGKHVARAGALNSAGASGFERRHVPEFPTASGVAV